MPLASALLVSLVGLGGTDDGSGGGSQQQQQQQPPSQQQQQQPQQQSSPVPSPSPSSSGVVVKTEQRALYFASLSPLNGSDVTGHAGVVVDGDSVGVSLQASGLAPNQMHPQYLNPEAPCPEEANSSNTSLDPSASLGFPLSLANQKGSFPLSSTNGNLTYIQSFPENAISNALDLSEDVIEILSVNSQPLACGKLYRIRE